MDTQSINLEIILHRQNWIEKHLSKPVNPYSTVNKLSIKSVPFMAKKKDKITEATEELRKLQIANENGKNNVRIAELQAIIDRFNYGI